MLAATAVASPPLALMPFTTSSQAGSLRLETTTLAPCAAICSQIERPMPRLPPVTTATLPLRSNIIGRLLDFRLCGEQRNQLDMRRPEELVDRHQFLQPVSAVLQGARVAREAAGIAGAIDDPRHLRAGEFGDLRGGARARRIEHDGVEGVELLRHQRIAEQVAALAPSRGCRRSCAPRPRPPRSTACRSRTGPARPAGRATARRCPRRGRRASAHRRSRR